MNTFRDKECRPAVISPYICNNITTRRIIIIYYRRARFALTAV